MLNLTGQLGNSGYGNAARYLTNLMRRSFDLNEQRRGALAFLDHLEKTDPVKASEFRYQVGDLLERSTNGGVILCSHDEEGGKGVEIKIESPARTLWLSFCKFIGIPWCCTYAIRCLYSDGEWMPHITYFSELHELGKNDLNFEYLENMSESLAGQLALKVTDQEQKLIIRFMSFLIEKRFDQFLIEEYYDVIVKLVSCGALPITRLERLPESFKATLLETDLGL